MVEMKDVEVGTVFVDARGGIAIVMVMKPDRPKHPFTYAVKASGTQYKGNVNSIRAIIGKADVAAFKAAVDKPVFNTVAQDGENSEWNSFVDNFHASFPWSLSEKLKDLKVGDKIIVSHGHKEVEAIYEGYKASRPKYPITYTINGKRWKGRLEGIIRKEVVEV